MRSVVQTVVSPGFTELLFHSKADSPFEPVMKETGIFTYGKTHNLTLVGLRSFL